MLRKEQNRFSPDGEWILLRKIHGRVMTLPYDTNQHHFNKGVIPTMNAQEIIEYIRTSEKKTPVKV